MILNEDQLCSHICHSQHQLWNVKTHLHMVCIQESRGSGVNCFSWQMLLSVSIDTHQLIPLFLVGAHLFLPGVLKSLFHIRGFSSLNSGFKGFVYWMGQEIQNIIILTQAYM